MSELSAAVAKSFEKLIATGFVSIEVGAPDDAHFGNEVVLLRASNMRIRFIRDRGQVYVEIDCTALLGDWHPFPRVLRALGIAEYSEGPVEVDEAARILSRHARLIDERICSQETVSRLKSLAAEARLNFLKRLKGEAD